MNSERDLLYRLRNAPELVESACEFSGSELAIQQQLRRRFDGDLVRAALSLAEARRKAHGILPAASQLWLTPAGVEQATHPQVAAHKAARFPVGAPLLDLCCGVGSDAAALIQRGPVTVIDRDVAMLQRCLWNLGIWQCRPTDSVVKDVRNIPLKGCLVHVDPDRRAAGGRPVRRLEHYSPDLPWMQQAVQTAAGGTIKIGPASNFMQKFPGCETELISLGGECREAAVWFGQLAGPESFRATVLPAGETIAADPLSALATKARAPGKFVLDPDPAVVRSGLIDVVCDRHGLKRLDDEEEYLTSDFRPETTFVTAFEVEAVLPNNQKKLRTYLREHPGCRYEIKCRRIPVETVSTTKKLPVGDGPIKVVLFLRFRGRAGIVIARRVKAKPQSATD